MAPRLDCRGQHGRVGEPGPPRPAGHAQASSVAGVGSANCARTRPMSTARGNPCSSSDLRMAAVRAMSSSGASNGRRIPRAEKATPRRRPRPPARARHSGGRARPGWNRPRASYRKPAQFVRRRRPDRLPGRAGRLRPDPLEPSSRIALDYERRGGLSARPPGRAAEVGDQMVTFEARQLDGETEDPADVGQAPTVDRLEAGADQEGFGWLEEVAARPGLARLAARWSCPARPTRVDHLTRLALWLVTHPVQGTSTGDRARAGARPGSPARRQGWLAG